ncbi:MAG TPA: helix-turn-helix domain-containing protein [Longimicrobiaceae bacterium]|jgi:AcrR family transcriptional regulator|nr:helix-turn-helix domain-containing protein [Longimicrobiaceae bacterium]
MTESPMRADAQRNRDRLLEVAVRAFSQGGADVPLDAIAKEAGVGIGTLYRHFPTREALVEAAYRSELARVCDSAGALLAASAPEVALREWMGRFIAYLAAKRGMVDALRAVIASGGNPYEQSRARMTDAVRRLVEAGAAAGTVRGDVEPADIVTSLSGVSLAAADPAQRERLLDLLMDGLRVRS